LIHLIQHSQNPSLFPVCEYNFSLLRAKLTNEKKAIEDKIKSFANMNVAELTNHMKAPLQDDEAAVILTSGFRAQPNVAAAPKKNIDSNMERRDTKVTFAPSSVTKPRASSSLVQNLEPATQKIVNAEDHSELHRNL
jgi:hypothetical protein